MPQKDEDQAHHVSVMTCRDLAADSELSTAFAPVSPTPADSGDAGRRICAVVAGVVLLVAATAGLHGLYRSDDELGDLAVWAAPLLFWISCLGGAVKLAIWGLGPVSTAVFDSARARLSEAAEAVIASVGVIAGVLGLWWTLRGGYSTWWQDISGEQGWSLLLGVGQILVAILAGAALFTGGKYLLGLAQEALGNDAASNDTGAHSDPPVGKSQVWHPGAVAALIAGGTGLVIVTAWLTPQLAPAIAGANVLPAMGAMALVLVVAVGSNLGWWKGLVGLWKWATDASQKASATAGVVALLLFSAGGLGLGWFTPATVPQAHAACPPDCGSPGGLDGPPGGGQMFQPPSQGGQQMPDYQGSNSGSSGLDQNNGISIHNSAAPQPGQAGSQQSAQQPDPNWQTPQHGTQIPDYQNATPYTQGPGRPNPDYNPGGQSNPGSQGGQPNQGVQQPAQQPQQAPQQQPPQQNTGQQPNQQPQQSDSQKIDDLTRQLQDQQQQSGQDRQRLDDLTKQLQQQNKPNQKQQQLPKLPSKDKKKDDKDDRDKQSGDNDLTALLMGAASTRRRKQDKQQGPDTQALGQDASQAVQGLPGDVQTYVQSGQQIGESSGQAAQGFGSAAQAGASLASSAQSGAVNPQDAITLVQGVSQGIQGTADAINAGSQIVKTGQKEADQVAQAVGDANPQLKPQMQQFTQLNDTVSKGTEGVGQIASGVSQVSGIANTFSGMGSGGLPDTSGAGDLLSQGGTTTPMSGGSGLGGHLAQAPQDVGDGGSDGPQIVSSPRLPQEYRVVPNDGSPTYTSFPPETPLTPPPLPPSATPTPATSSTPPPPPPGGITAEQLQQVMSSQGGSFTMQDAENWLPSINQALNTIGATTPDRQAAFLAQIGEESGGLNLLTEKPWGDKSLLDLPNWDPQVNAYFNQKYGDRTDLGNLGSNTSDGSDFRGQGILQITGRSNYAQMSQKLFGDDRLLTNSKLLAQPDAAAKSAAQYWVSNNLNSILPDIDSGQLTTAQQFQDLGSRINTGKVGNVPDGASVRVDFWQAAKSALGMS